VGNDKDQKVIKSYLILDLFIATLRYLQVARPSRQAVGGLNHTFVSLEVEIADFPRLNLTIMDTGARGYINWARN